MHSSSTVTPGSVRPHGRCGCGWSGSPVSTGKASSTILAFSSGRYLAGCSGSSRHFDAVSLRLGVHFKDLLEGTCGIDFALIHPKGLVAELAAGLGAVGSEHQDARFR